MHIMPKGNLHSLALVAEANAIENFAPTWNASQGGVTPPQRTILRTAHLDCTSIKEWKSLKGWNLRRGEWKAGKKRFLSTSISSVLAFILENGHGGKISKYIHM
ncbi:uncharacterized protein TM35_000141830 [Trypanosoma theileri]|uniref:Uncharacterized protein n=1 Tax=Trypanosoma theileri TaxID=67003 RepID=A0A1X0NWB8_9TRYP|nr:uncharacterized protein TM35_000141830 [Trypanosoma theileri]ORC88972.1 hypothetical protein TM35_000141830 [Trypanosoma theileri]